VLYSLLKINLDTSNTINIVIQTDGGISFGHGLVKKAIPRVFS